MKNRCILHGRVFVMTRLGYEKSAAVHVNPYYTISVCILQLIVDFLSFHIGINRITDAHGISLAFLWFVQYFIDKRL